MVAELDTAEVRAHAGRLGGLLCEGLWIERQGEREGQAVATWADRARSDLADLVTVGIRAAGRMTSRLSWSIEALVAAILVALA